MTLSAAAVGARQGYEAAFERLAPRGPEWLRSCRRRAFARFAALGLPTERDEDWRFTPVGRLAEASFAPARRAAERGPADPDAISWLLDAPHRLVFVDGHCVPALSRLGSLPAGARVSVLAASLESEGEFLEPSLSEAGSSGRAFEALNAALFEDGALVRLDAGAVLEDPLHLLFLSGAGDRPALSVPRCVIRAGAGSRARIVMEFVGLGPGAGLTNAATDLILEEGASVELSTAQRDGAGAYHVACRSARLARDSRLEDQQISLGAALARQDVRVDLLAPGAEASLNGLYLASGRQHVDHHTRVRHLGPSGASRELYKGILDGEARAVFNGLIEVAPDAQKTTASVYNKNLLLSDKARVDTKPEFKINANDVQCRHGGAIGQLSADALHYLRSRGVGLADARRTLLYAFASEMVERLGCAGLRGAVDRLLLGRMEGGHA